MDRALEGEQQAAGQRMLMAPLKRRVEKMAAQATLTDLLFVFDVEPVVGADQLVLMRGLHHGGCRGL